MKRQRKSGKILHLPGGGAAPIEKESEPVKNLDADISVGMNLVEGLVVISASKPVDLIGLRPAMAASIARQLMSFCEVLTGEPNTAMSCRDCDFRATFFWPEKGSIRKKVKSCPACKGKRPVFKNIMQKK